MTPRPDHRAGRLESYNRLRRGTHYRATTRRGNTSGEYLGLETVVGDWAILLRDPSGTVSIPLGHLTSIWPLEA
jgi:hypothetical protein